MLFRSGHTPGPWAYGSFGRLLVVQMVNGLPDKHSPVCDLGQQVFPSAGRKDYADAALIAAAPTLLSEVTRQAAEIGRLKAALNDILSAIPAIQDGTGFFLEHHSPDGEYLGASSVDPVQVVFCIAAITSKALENSND